MVFTQFEFLCVFLPFVLLINEKIRENFNTVLFILSSILFYSLWKAGYLPLLLGSIFINYYFSRWIYKKRSKNKLIASIVLNLLPLFIFKYAKFVCSNLGINCETTWLLRSIEDELPLGISFYTFQQIAYIVDIYKKNVKPHGIKNYLFFVTFFPHLVAGPLLHPTDIINQIGKKIDKEAFFIQGVIYFLIGFCKKVFIADTLAAIVDPLFLQAQAQSLNFYQSFVATFGYTFQLYFDFSGYSDMAIGLGLLFGYQLPINFNSPYKAVSIQDFWRRWHITLSHFLRNYIYIPLGGNRHGKIRNALNLFIVMLIGGFWHGASWTFIVWGALHGIFLVVEKFFNLSSNPKRTKIYQLRTFLTICLLWVIFRAKDFTQVKNIYSGFLNLSGSFLTIEMLMLLGVCMLVMCQNSHFYAFNYQSIPRGLITYVQKLMRRVRVYFLITLAIYVGSLVIFYVCMIGINNFDYYIYKYFNAIQQSEGIKSEKGDFRSNLLSLDMLHGNEKKVVFVGSSFTMSIGAFHFKMNGEDFKSGSIGIQGDPILNGLRSASAILEIPHIHTIVFGVSPLNMRSSLSRYVSKLPFGEQGLEELKRVGVDVSLFNSIKAIVYSFSPYNGFLFKIKKYRTEKNIDIYKNNKENMVSVYGIQKNFTKHQKDPVRDQKNGADIKFHWLKRGVHESLEEKGEIYQALKNLKALCDAKGIKLVIYDTPTPKHNTAPHIYPEGFLENYRKLMHKMCHELHIPYNDYIDLFPWDGKFMSDFVHPTEGARKFLHLKVLQDIFKEKLEIPTEGASR